jgi:hypothetical protein
MFLLEAKNKKLWEDSYNRNFEKWRQTEAAYKVLEVSGFDAKLVLPYHKREWKAETYQFKYSISSVEVEE